MTDPSVLKHVARQAELIDALADYHDEAGKFRRKTAADDPDGTWKSSPFTPASRGGRAEKADDEEMSDEERTARMIVENTDALESLAEDLGLSGKAHPAADDEKTWGSNSPFTPQESN